MQWIEGVAICVAILIVTVVAALNDWQKERAFVKLNAKKEDREIKAIRSGKSYMLNVHDILVGDVLHLEPGDLIPVDGIFISGHDLKCDESSATGESDAIKKTSADQVMSMLESGHPSKNLDPFIISGAKVIEGMGTFVCTSVGVHSSFGQIMMSVRTETESTPLQKKLEGLAVAIAKLGGSAAALLFVVLLCRFLAGLPSDTRPAPEKASDFMDILIVAITIIVVAVPEGLPLAVTLALAFATTRLLKENNLVRVLRACETMGNATTICSDKTGTLTTNRMTVVAGTFGASSFDKPDSERPDAQSLPQWASGLSSEAKEAIVQSVAMNSTAFEGEDGGETAFIGSKTETALLQLAKDHLGMQSLPETRGNERVVQMMPFDSLKKCMGAVLKLRSGRYRLLVKGASEILLDCCASKADMKDLSTSELTQSDRDALTGTIDSYARQSLRTIGLVYRDFESWPPAGIDSENGHVELSAVLKDVVFLGLVGIQDPVRAGVPEAVKKAQHAGVVVRMVTGDNAVTAQAIATECGIYTDGVIMEGPAFRRLSEEQMNETLPRLQVLARSSPEDKRILVTRLKALGETVAVTGDGTNDAPALKAADVGFSMGIAGTEVAKEASSIVLMDDNFASIVVALKWGRAVNDAVQKFLQVCWLCLLVYHQPSPTDSIPVPSDGQHHGCAAGFHQRRVGPRDGVGAQGRAAALGQPHHGHLCRPGPRHGSAYGAHSGQEAPAEERAPDHDQHVEDDHRPGHPAALGYAGLALCGPRDPRVRPQRRDQDARDRHDGLQYVCVDADLQRVQQPPPGQQVQYLRGCAPQPVLYRH